MDERSQAVLNRILEKDLSGLTIGDIVFLKARRSYLNAEQVEKYKNYLDQGIRVVEDRPSYKELREEAKALGLKLKIGIKREILEEMIDQAKK